MHMQLRNTKDVNELRELKTLINKAYMALDTKLEK